MREGKCPKIEDLHAEEEQQQQQKVEEQKVEEQEERTAAALSSLPSNAVIKMGLAQVKAQENCTATAATTSAINVVPGITDPVLGVLLFFVAVLLSRGNGATANKSRLLVLLPHLLLPRPKPRALPLLPTTKMFSEDWPRIVSLV